MVATIEVRGAEQMRLLGKELKMAGIEGKGLRRELLAGMRVAAKPMAEAAKQAARDELPKHGGLNEWVASSKFSVRNSLTGNGAGTRIVARKPGGKKGAHDMAALDDGIARHPVFGHRNAWKDTTIKAGWFSDTLDHHAITVQIALLAALRNIAEQIARG
jgi:hypothetical protein